MTAAPGTTRPGSQPADRTRLRLGTHPPDGPEGDADPGAGIWRLDLDLTAGAFPVCLLAG